MELVSKLILLLLLAIVATGCGGEGGNNAEPDGSDDSGADTSAEDISITDVGVDVVDSGADSAADSGDVASGVLNACGGLEELLRNGVPASPGDTCGCTGLVVCDGANLLMCVGDTPRNECGACGVLEARPGTSCGVCGDGVWTCDEETGGVVCDGAVDRNLCGGCEALDGLPGFVCDGDEGVGVWTCEGPDEVLCLGVGRNACGGSSLLESFPGVPCGACGGGKVTCDGRDELFCFGPDRRVNECGGCGALPGSVGEDCGCGGTWACAPDNPNQLICAGSISNECGGCSSLDATPGDDCGTNGVQICASPERLVCLEGAGLVNACGGEAPLGRTPGDACGVCGNGRIACVTPDNAVCVGNGPANACPGCGSLDGVEGDVCARGGLFVCGEDGDLDCLLDGNDCGGVWELDNEPGTPCGPCGLGRYACDGPDETVCVGVPDDVPLYYLDDDGDGFGAGEGFEVEDCEDLPDGVSATAGDCNDDEDAVFPGATEICDGEDNDCDDVIDNAAAADASCVLDQAISQCVEGRCAVALCDDGFGDCDGFGDNGCEQSLDTVDHCGACDATCTVADGVGECSTGTCAIDTCFGGFGDCDGLAESGCETPLNTAANCSECGVECRVPNGTGSCDTGTCEVDSCDAGFEDCDTDPLNGCEQALSGLDTCGGCSGVCAYDNAVGSCESGVCEFVECDPGFANCDGFLVNGCETPVNTLTDCGACGTPCEAPGGVTDCSTGTCELVACELGFDNCDLDDVNGCETPVTTTLDCGACGVPCAFDNATGECSTGVCTFVECAAEFGDCDGDTANGCEADLTSEATCGSCTNACGDRQSCQAGVCAAPVVVDVAAGEDHTCAITDLGDVLCWGRNNAGQTGQAEELTLYPTLVAGLPGSPSEIAAGAATTCAVIEGGVWCWGAASVRAGAPDGATPVRIDGVSNAVDIALGEGHACAQTLDGDVLCWGDNRRSQAGAASGTQIDTPTLVSGLTDVAEIAAARLHNCARQDDGRVFCWGEDDNGRLGPNSTSNTHIPVEVTGLGATVEIGIGQAFGCARVVTGAVACWGDMPGPLPAYSTPTVIAPIADRLWAGNLSYCYQVATGDTYCGGENRNGELGVGSLASTESAPATTADTLSAIRTPDRVEFGTIHSCTLTTRGLFCAGEASFSRLGDGQGSENAMNRRYFVPVSELATASTETFSCGDSVDNDADGLADCADLDCIRDLGSSMGESVGRASITPSDSALREGSCGGNGPEVRFLWTAPSDGLFRFTTDESDYDTVLYAQDAACDAPELACDDDGGAVTGTSALTLRATTGQTIVIVIDTDVDVAVSGGNAVLSIFDAGCTDSQLDCDGDPLNSCEIDTQTDEDHCGACFTPCPGVQACVDGSCVVDEAVDLALGSFHGCAVMASGRVRCWGNSGRAGLGIPDASGVLSISEVAPGVYDAVEVSASQFSVCVLTETGRVLCSSRSGSGSAGTGTSTSQLRFQEVLAPVTFTSLHEKEDGHCAIDEEGDLWCWGENSESEVGDGSTEDRFVPVRVPVISNVVDAHGSTQHTCAALADGRVYCWGQNDDQQLGDGTTNPRTRPVPVDGITDAVQVIANTGDTRSSSCALTRSGAVICWGEFQEQRTTDASDAEVVMTGITQLDGGFAHFCGLDGEGQLLCSGSNANARTGNGLLAGNASDRLGRERFTNVVLSGLVDVEVGPAQTCVLTGAGVPMCSGENAEGQLGDGQLAPEADMARFGTVVGFGMPSSERGLCRDGIDNDGDGTIDADDGDCVVELGSIIGTQVWRDFVTNERPNQFNGTCAAGGGREYVLGWTAPDTGRYAFHTAGSIPDTLLYARTGALDGPELGCAQDGEPDGSPRLTADLSAGQRIYIFVEPRLSGTLGSIQLTIEDTACTATQLDCDSIVTNGCEANTLDERDNCGECGIVCPYPGACEDGTCVAESVTEIAGDVQHSCAITESGGVWCWGRAGFAATFVGGRHGERVAEPREVGTLPAPAVSLAANRGHTIALLEDGSLYTWGDAFRGQLGIGSLTFATYPQPVLLDAPAIDVCAGDGHSCAVTDTNEVWCWGENTFGEVDPSLPDENYVAPLRVEGAPAATAIGCGNAFTCAIDLAGDVWCWGANSLGQLGDGTTAPRTGFIQVADISSAVDITAESESAMIIDAAGDLWVWGAWPTSESPAASMLTSGVESVSLSGAFFCVAGPGGVGCDVAGTDFNGVIGQGPRAEPSRPELPLRMDTRVPPAGLTQAYTTQAASFFEDGEGRWWVSGLGDWGQNAQSDRSGIASYPYLVPALGLSEPANEWGLCTDGIDNDGNGALDCEDPVCARDLGSVVGDNVAELIPENSTGDFVEVSCYDGFDVSFEVSHRWTAPETRRYRVTADTGSSGAGHLGVFEGCFVTEIGCAVNTGFFTPAVVEFDAVAGEQYVFVAEPAIIGGPSNFLHITPL